MSKYRVMVVDDDPDIRFVTTGLLGDDFEMVQAESGLDALEKIERYEPDLILLDIFMPIMDGFATCRSIRRHNQFSDIPVFFLTGASSADSRRKADDAGSQAFVEKPFEADPLAESIRAFFTKDKVTPRLKTFTMRDLHKIDQTPLRTADGAEEPAGEADEPIPGIASAQEPEAEQPEPKKRKRRVFGAGRATPAEEPPADATGGLTKEIALPKDLRKEEPPPAEEPPQPPAAPEYPSLPKRKKFSVTPSETSGFFGAPPGSAQRSEPARAEPPKEPAPPAKVEPPKPPAPAPPPSPVRARPHRPIPASAKSGRAITQRPRVLCMIADSAEMKAYTFALKGLAEFLPLEDPVEAVEIIARFQPDIVSMRLVGGEYSGLQLAQLLKSNPRLSHTEVLFLDTGRETQQQLSVAARLSGNSTVRVPATDSAIRRAIQQIASKPVFRIREKKLSYGAYVSEVLQSERSKAEAVRQQKEREFEKNRVSALGDFMQDLRKEVGDADIPEALKPKTAQAYYLS